MHWKPCTEKWSAPGHVCCTTKHGDWMAGPRKSDGCWEFSPPGEDGDWFGVIDHWDKPHCLSAALKMDQAMARGEDPWEVYHLKLTSWNPDAEI